MPQADDFKVLLAPVALALLLAMGGYAPAMGELTNEAVQKLVADAKLWPDGRVSVLCRGTEVLISTYRDRRETSRDCKIDAILLTRKIQAADHDVTRVTIRFYNAFDQKRYDQIEVRKTDIAAFANRLVDDEKLLSGISITQGQDLPDVVAGPFGEERAAIKQHIANLQEKGVGIATYLRLFSEVEELATKADHEAKTTPDANATPSPSGTSSKSTLDQLRTNLTFLGKKLDEEDKVLRDSRQHAAATAESAAAAHGTKEKNAAAPAAQTARRTPIPSKLDLGGYRPPPGPYLLDRLFIGHTLNQKFKQGYSTKDLVPVWLRMNGNAVKNDERDVRTDVEYLNAELGLSTLTDEERKSYSVVQY